MKHSLLSVICISFLISVNCGPMSTHRTELYVSPSGNDSWSGKLPEPKKDGSDGPFATLEKARDTIRSIKSASRFPSGGITVLIRGGTYRITETFILNAGDSGTSESPISWQAYPGEQVIFTGGISLIGFKPVADPAIIARIGETYRDSILVTDLKAQGITQYGTINPRSGHRPELFFKHTFMTVARYPNDGWLTIADVPQTGERRIIEGLDRDKSPVPRGRHYGRFTYDGDRPNRWAESDDIWMHGYWTWDWADEYLRVTRIDTSARTIYPAEPHHNYGYTKGHRFYFLNVLEELDTPGEWYIDRASGMLYFWPPEPVRDGDAVMSLLEQPMISLDNASFITIRGITFEGSRTGAVQISGGAENRLAGCTLRNLGNTAVTVSGGTRNGVTGCDMYALAGGCINVDGGDRKTLTPAGNYAENNYLHHFGIVFRTGNPGVGISGVGNILSHNYIHDAPNAAVFFSGNDLLLEYNEVSNIALETSDVGAFYSGRDWTMRGHIIRYNYFHHLNNSDGVGVMGVYLDDSFSSATIFGNIFYKAGRAVFIGGGRDNTVENNIFVECAPSVHIDSRGLTWCKEYNARGGSHQMYQKLEAVNWNRPPFSTRYPALATILDGDPNIPSGNQVLRNISCGGRWMDLYDDLIPSDFTIRDNLVADPELLHSIPVRKNVDVKVDRFTTLTNGDPASVTAFSGNTVISGDPGFMDAAHGDFRLRKDSPAWKLGFKPIPVEKIGLYMDEFRKTIPQ